MTIKTTRKGETVRNSGQNICFINNTLYTILTDTGGETRFGQVVWDLWVISDLNTIKTVGIIFVLTKKQSFEVFSQEGD